MIVNLPVKSFAFFKVILGCFILFLSIPISFSGYVYKIAQFLAGAHFLGAYLAMWKAGKLSVKYVIWIIVITLVSSFLVYKTTSIQLLFFLIFGLFYFHFLFDEFDLQEERKSFNNLLSVANPTVLLFLLLFKDFFHLNIGIFVFALVSLHLLAIELIFIKEINWFFIHTKILAIFALVSVFYSVSTFSIWSVTLVYHYIFWFIYPVYKLHKYNREERDGFIMIIIILITIFAFIYSPNNYNIPAVDGLRLLLIASVVHVLTTAPFGYYFGLPRPKYITS